MKHTVPKGEIATSKDAKGLSAFAGMTRLLLFYLIVGSIILLTFIPFYDPQFISNYTQTAVLWFQDFEFNASLYYVAREIGYWFRGYNEIAIIGKIIPVAVLFFVLLLTFFKKNKTMIQLVASMLLALSIYYFTATTVHLWYIATLLLLSLFSKYKFPLVWSFVIVLSYSAYTLNGFNENLWIVTLEYLIVYGVLIYELWFKTDKLLEKQLCNKHIDHLNQD